MRFQLEFYSCASVWTLWPLKSDFQVSFMSLTMKQQQCRIQSNGSAGTQEERQRFMLMPDHFKELGGRNDAPPSLLHSRLTFVYQHSYVVTDAYVVTTATHEDKLLMSGHTNPI